ncbi:potassium channel family protein [Leptolyngbya ohadii]|uniref:potassium channel family protein n=1 Tax=Leptolyngbya ohadii TaxID=1962290 RepID=UPI001CEDD074|nr:potassium channel family protein [Leptolyngbya ohadii]
MHPLFDRFAQPPSVDRLLQIVGLVLILIALIDVYLIVLYPRSGRGWLSSLISKGTWRLFQKIAKIGRSVRRSEQFGAAILSFCGPTLLILIVLAWTTLMIVGFACVYQPELGQEIQASDGFTPVNFTTALYYSGYVFTTLGVGDLVPRSDWVRIVTVIEAGLGFAIFTLTLTYLLSIYNALGHRNVFALMLHHRTMGKADAAELLARMGTSGDFSDARDDVAELAKSLLILLESHHAYPVVHYFRFQNDLYSLARIVWLAMDTVTLINTALHPDRYRAFIRSTVVAELANGGQHLLMELSYTFLPKRSFTPGREDELILKQRYLQAIDRLRQEGIETVTDLEAGIEQYIQMRRRWVPYVMAIAHYMGYRWHEVAPSESPIVRETGWTLAPPRL